MGFVGGAEPAHVGDDHAGSCFKQPRDQAGPSLDGGLGRRRREAHLFPEQRDGSFKDGTRQVEVPEVSQAVQPKPLQKDDRRSRALVVVSDPGPVKRYEAVHPAPP